MNTLRFLWFQRSVHACGLLENDAEGGPVSPDLFRSSLASFTHVLYTIMANCNSSSLQDLWNDHLGIFIVKIHKLSIRFLDLFCHDSDLSGNEQLDIRNGLSYTVTVYSRPLDSQKFVRTFGPLVMGLQQEQILETLCSEVHWSAPSINKWKQTFFTKIFDTIIAEASALVALDTIYSTSTDHHQPQIIPLTKLYISSLHHFHHYLQDCFSKTHCEEQARHLTWKPPKASYCLKTEKSLPLPLQQRQHSSSVEIELLIPTLLIPTSRFQFHALSLSMVTFQLKISCTQKSKVSIWSFAMTLWCVSASSLTNANIRCKNSPNVRDYFRGKSFCSLEAFEKPFPIFSVD